MSSVKVTTSKGAFDVVVSKDLFKMIFALESSNGGQFQIDQLEIRCAYENSVVITTPRAELRPQANDMKIFTKWSLVESSDKPVELILEAKASDDLWEYLTRFHQTKVVPKVVPKVDLANQNGKSYATIFPQSNAASPEKKSESKPVSRSPLYKGSFSVDENETWETIEKNGWAFISMPAKCNGKNCIQKKGLKCTYRHDPSEFKDFKFPDFLPAIIYDNDGERVCGHGTCCARPDCSFKHTGRARDNPFYHKEVVEFMKIPKIAKFIQENADY